MRCLWGLALVSVATSHDPPDDVNAMIDDIMSTPSDVSAMTLANHMTPTDVLVD
jgi:hypothetical protein